MIKELSIPPTMKPTEKKESGYTYLGKDKEVKKGKRTSGDKQFDEAIDKLLKPIPPKVK